MGNMEIGKAFNDSGRTKSSRKGIAGYDNTRENIDPFIKTQVLSTKAITLSDGTIAGYVKNDANGVLTGGNAVAGGGDVTAAVALTDATIVQGDGGVKGVKTSTATVAQIAANVTHAAGDGSDHADVASNTTHAADSSQAHSDYLLNSGTDIAVGPLTITADNSSADTAYVPMVLYNTDATPPAASGFPIGTLYVQYTA